MKILITGICGFIGSNLSRALINAGHEVHGVDNLSSGHLDYLHPEVARFFEADIAAEHGLGCLGEGDEHKYDMVFHLASRKIPRHGGAIRVLLENNLTTIWAAARARQDGARLVFASTSDIYGMNGDFHEGAGSVLGPTDVPRWSYAITKIWSEQYLFANKDLDFVVLRYFGSYGPFHSGTWTAGPQAVFIDQAIRCEPITLHGGGKQTRCFTHIDDTVVGTVLAAFSEHSRMAFNIGNPYEEITIRALGEKIWGVVNPGTPFQSKTIPYSKEKYQDVMRRVPDISLSRDLLGFEPVVFQDEGLRRMIDWEITRREAFGNGEVFGNVAVS